MASKLSAYRQKRDFAVTPEPPPSRAPRAKKRARAVPTFMVHKHDATRLHYDLRLEMDDALASWAVPKGPSYDPKVRRLAVETEDHPIEYGGFEGRIPDGQYGAGDSVIWDRGTYETEPPGQASAMRKKGHIYFELRGEKLKGRWHLVRTSSEPGHSPQWMLFKSSKDEHANPSYDVISDRPESVVSGRRVTRGPVRASARRDPGHEPDELLEKTASAKAPLRLAVSHGRAALHAGKIAPRSAMEKRFCAAAAALEVAEAVVAGRPGGEGKKFVATDLLWLDGQDLQSRPPEERRDLLASVLANAPATFAAARSRAHQQPKITRWSSSRGAD
jgi:bifunctional non-homologous end joining protein LigD